MTDKELVYFRFLDLHFYWEGQLQTGLFQKQFALSRPSAQKYIQQYIFDHQRPIEYVETLKSYVLKGAFLPTYVGGEFDEYTNVTAGKILTNLSSGQVHHITLPKRQLEPEILRPILTACRYQSALDITYLSLKENGESERIIRPHTLVNTGLRYHLRAFCEKSGKFQDFSLSRILAAEPELASKARHTKEEDTKWQQHVELMITPDPRLSLHAQAVIARDYQMNANKAVINTNAALVNYLINLLRLDCLHPSPEAQQIVIDPTCYRMLREEGLLWNV
ncbi:helix-turn-helix transcriptional regulator [Pseudoalteromonas xiamenensis]|uniref:WYL domain-containing protein n=1 Tax=Pseudoalteromonas xiamenensis TaxID=882626 RepID=A0A975HNB5_9GAMM|nr:WYL domain-containing protein [Pseudoalteromonas xiamenensis]QTH72040.1 WYL domain-containing protein [Pseudoalteromonas xiamenensis]